MQDLCHVIWRILLETAMSRAEYMRIHYKYFSPYIISIYHIDWIIVEDEHVYINIINGVYDLNRQPLLPIINSFITWIHTAIIQWPSHLDYGPWEQEKNYLCVDDFGVKHFRKDDADHIIESLKKHYVSSTDWEGCNHLGLTTYRNYSKTFVDILMP